MSNTFFISDTHFHHRNFWATFKLKDGSPLRPFSSTEEMDEYMVQRWNSVVKPADKVYHLGDITMGTNLDILSRLNGRKVLIKGNHDLAKPTKYLEHFYDIRGSHQFDGMLLTHIPVHEDSLARWGVNIHGHLHANKVLDKIGNPDLRYLCVSVEQINYTPISLDQVRKLIVK